VSERYYRALTRLWKGEGFWSGTLEKRYRV